MNRYEKQLLFMCDILLSHQITEGQQASMGGFYCDACTIIHGRADNAVLPLLYCYRLTKEYKYLQACERLLIFQAQLTNDDGSVSNDFSSPWKGITVFSALSYYKCLVYFSDIMPDEMQRTLQSRFTSMSEWVYNNISIGFRANSNYYAAASAVNAAAWRYFQQDKYAVRARQLSDYCLGLFTENGIFAGEGQPHTSKTENGCVPADMGYILEESLPCLVNAAQYLQDTHALAFLANMAMKLTDFILPDGGIDNSFGSRNNKWTYYGSRTSDLLAPAFVVLHEYCPILSEYAVKNINCMTMCMDENGLYGGRDYAKCKQKPCVHHLFSHASGLADALLCGLTEDNIAETDCFPPLPTVRYFPELNTYRINKGLWTATVTGYDYRTYTYTKGASHSAGGTMSLLYHKEKGIVLAGSVAEYLPTEENNMQLPEGSIKHASPILRAEYTKNGVLYATCLDFHPCIDVFQNDTAVTVCVKAHFCRLQDNAFEKDAPTAEFTYLIKDKTVDISVIVTPDTKEITLYVPLVGETVKLQTQHTFTIQKAFCLTPGFLTNEYAFKIQNNGVSLTLS